MSLTPEEYERFAALNPQPTAARERLAELRRRASRRVDPMPGVPETAEYAARQAAEMEPIRRMQMLPDDREQENP